MRNRLSSSATLYQHQRRRRKATTIQRCIIFGLGIVIGISFWVNVATVVKIDHSSNPIAGIQESSHQWQTAAKSVFEKYRSEQNSWNQPVEWKTRVERSTRQQSSPTGLCKYFDHSIKRPKHGCEVNKDTKTVFCAFENLKIDVRKMRMESRGGEVLSEVMGRSEKSEFPEYERGAFSTGMKPHYEVPAEYRQNLHYLEDVLNAIRYPTAKNHHKIDMTCQQVYRGTTLFLTRYEYANLYHTMTDWWNAFFALPRKRNGNDDNDDEMVQGVELPARVVFLDGHAQGLLDPTWKEIFGDYEYIRDMGESFCFERAIFVPAGYKSPLFNNEGSRLRCPHQGMTDAFTNFVLEQHGLLHRKNSAVVKGLIVLIDRQPFVSHPRSKVENFSRRFEPVDRDRLVQRLRSVKGATVKVVRLETLPFREQLALMRKTHILIGIHGAALSHLLFLDERRSHVIELMPESQIDFFQYMSEWKAIDYHSFDLLYNNSLSEDTMNELVETVERYIKDD